MAVTTHVRLFYLFHLSKPASDRPLYQAIHRNQARTIVELGIGDGQRALRMIEVASQHAPAAEIRYTGVDPFELRPAKDLSRLPLKTAYQVLRATGAKVRLLPGDPALALIRMVNELEAADLLLVSAEVCRSSMEKLWFYLPRILHAKTQVFLEEGSQDAAQMRVLSAAEIRRRAQHATPLRRAA